MHLILLDKRRPAHNFGDCQLVCYVGSKTIGEAVASFISNSCENFGEERKAEVTKLVDEHFAVHPTDSAVFGYYTPRGRKRRGLRTKQRRLFSIRLGTERYYFPGVVYNRRDISFTRDRVMMRCRCWGVNRANTPLINELWRVPAA